jgi:hypothetical protein
MTPSVSQHQTRRCAGNPYPRWAKRCLRECDRPLQLPGLVTALAEVITEHTHAMHDAARHLRYRRRTTRMRPG